jgi:hypothetical protein
MSQNKLKRRRRWHRLPGPLQDLVERVADEHPQWSAAQIFRHLCERNDDGAHKHPEVAKYGEPGEKSVQEIVRTSRPPDSSAPWEPTGWESGEDVSLVLEVIKHLGENDALIWPTLAEAERILWIRQTAPRLSLELAWRLTRRYIIYEAQQLPLKRLAWYLAFKPWESDANKELYFKMVPEQERVMYPVEASGIFRGGGRISVK